MADPEKKPDEQTPDSQESVKQASPEDAAKAAAAAPKKVEKRPQAPPIKPPPAAPPVKTVQPEQLVAVPPARLAGPTHFRATKGGMYSWYGSVTTIADGQVVDASSVGPDGLKRMRDAGIVLEPIAD